MPDADWDFNFEIEERDPFEPPEIESDSNG